MFSLDFLTFSLYDQNVRKAGDRSKWVDSSKRRNDAENPTLLNKSFDIIK